MSMYPFYVELMFLNVCVCVSLLCGTSVVNDLLQNGLCLWYAKLG